LGVALVGAALVAQAAMAGDTPVDRRSLLPRVQRTWMPEASPSSFAVGFSNGMNLCFDPERGQVVYAWQGDFVDMKPTLEIKFPQDAKIRGSILHRTPQDAFSNPDATRAEVRFTGYRVRANEVVFQFKIDLRAVALTVQANREKPGLTCRYLIEPAPSTLVYHPVNPDRVVIEGGAPKRDGAAFQITGGAVTQFSEDLSPP